MLAVTACLPQRLHAQGWTNGQAASFVIGQTGFGPNGASTTATGLNIPSQAIIDPATGKVFVSDWINNRVLRYPSSAAMTSGAAAEAVLGQVDFVSSGAGTTATTLDHPAGIALDPSGNLWVADEYNSRILCYANAATIASGAAASSELGEPDFVTQSFQATSQSLMFYPVGVFCSGTTLWITDFYNSRVLRFNNAASLANGAPADAVFGEPDFNTGFYNSSTVPSATQLNYPTQIYVDGADNLWVTDEKFNRVLMFPNASTAASSEAATKVLGQTDFTDDGSDVTASTFYYPIGIYGDGAGNIYVSEFYNNRILIFASAASLPNGSAASVVLGQTDFVSNGAGAGANQLSNPELLFITPLGSLLADDALNNRVLIYIPPVPLPLLLTSFTGRLQSNGQVLLQWQISDEGEPVPGQAGYTELEYATNATSGFTDVLNQQPIDPAAQNYSYLQVSPAAGTNYYRLRLILPDGSATYSQIVAVTVGSGATGLNIYPNPAQSNVAVKVPQTGKAEIDIYSITGMLIQRVVTGAVVNNIDISWLAAGMYMVRVVQGSSTVSGSFIKVN